MGQVTAAVTVSFRIGDPEGIYPIFDAGGSVVAPGRWNTSAYPVIYTSRYYSTAILEKLAHGSGAMPPNQHFIRITIPHGVSYEVFSHNDPANKGWDDLAPNVSRTWGDRWVKQNRSLLLFVPSVVAREDQNILINPAHDDFSTIMGVGFVSYHQPVVWDSRLFGSSP